MWGLLYFAQKKMQDLERAFEKQSKECQDDVDMFLLRLECLFSEQRISSAAACYLGNVWRHHQCHETSLTFEMGEDCC